MVSLREPEPEKHVMEADLEARLLCLRESTSDEELSFIAHTGEEIDDSLMCKICRIWHYDETQLAYHYKGKGHNIRTGRAKRFFGLWKKVHRVDRQWTDNSEFYRPRPVRALPELPQDAAMATRASQPGASVPRAAP